MDDREFFDKLYQLWTNTTYAENRYWDYQPEEAKHGFNTLQTINAVGQEEGQSLPVAWGVYEPDAEWITALHGCFPDLWRRLHAALDEADAADLNRDSRECRIFELECEVADLQKTVERLSSDPPWHQRR